MFHVDMWLVGKMQVNRWILYQGSFPDARLWVKTYCDDIAQYIVLNQLIMTYAHRLLHWSNSTKKLLWQNIVINTEALNWLGCRDEEAIEFSALNGICVSHLPLKGTGIIVKGAGKNSLRGSGWLMEKEFSDHLKAVTRINSQRMWWHAQNLCEH